MEGEKKKEGGDGVKTEEGWGVVAGGRKGSMCVVIEEYPIREVSRLSQPFVVWLGMYNRKE